MILKKMLFYSLKTVFTEILKTRIFKLYYLCLQIYIKSYEAIIFFNNNIVLI